MKYLLVLMIAFGAYLGATDSGRELFQTAKKFVMSPIDKANKSKAEMNERNQNMKNELDRIVE